MHQEIASVEANSSIFAEIPFSGQLAFPWHQIPLCTGL